MFSNRPLRLYLSIVFEEDGFGFLRVWKFIMVEDTIGTIIAIAVIDGWMWEVMIHIVIAVDSKHWNIFHDMGAVKIVMLDTILINKFFYFTVLSKRQGLGT
jgi:hypothetical protein